MGFWRRGRLRTLGLASFGQPPQTEVAHDVAMLLWSSELALIKRFYDQPYWEAEGRASQSAAAIEGTVRLESVADHSWKVADAVLILVDHFPGLNRCRTVELAILHDKLELVTGDLSPIDADGTGDSTHAFNPAKALEKRRGESQALERYLSIARPELASRQESIFGELIDGSSLEARFVKAVDKLASLTYVIQAKRGRMDNRHIKFTLAYAAKAVEYFPALARHHDTLVQVFLDGIHLEDGNEYGSSDHGGQEHRPLRTIG